ncbi:aquaporin [Pseudarthrobacter sp. J1763]|uniref:aquaporin n=1 Tax=Pseudarthrobacter sp. J1763 TaxID=3420445 RepID=UPI003D2801A5
MTTSSTTVPVDGPETTIATTGLVGRLSAEAFGTFLIVLAGLGAVLFVHPNYQPMQGPVATGLAVTVAMLAVGHLSGGHFNPAISLGSAIAGRTAWKDAGLYAVAQLLGGLLGLLSLLGVVQTISGANIPTVLSTLASGFDDHSLYKVPLAGVLLLEVIGAAILVGLFLAARNSRANSWLATSVAVGLGTAVLAQTAQAISNSTFNPVRATAVALFSESWAIGQLWLFWVAPLLGAAIAGLIVRGFAAAAPASAAGTTAIIASGDEDADSDFDDSEELSDVADESNETSAAGTAEVPAGASVQDKVVDEDARNFFDAPPAPR